MQRTITIPANGTYPLRVKGQILTILSATAPFKVDTDRDGMRTMDAERKLGSPGAPPFNRLIFYETSGAANTITFYVGERDLSVSPAASGGSTIQFKYDLVALSAPFVTTNDTPGTPVPLAALSVGFRKAKLIARKDLNALGVVVNAGNVAIGGGNGAVGTQGMLLAPGDEVVLEAPFGETWDFNQIYLDVENAGDGVAIVIWSA